MKKALLALVLCIGFGNTVAISQKINNYKYISIPNQFEFQREVNSYEINELTKFLFNKYNFEAFLAGDKKYNRIPPCDVLRASMLKKSGLVNTKIRVVLKDCNGEIIYNSREGISIKKDYKQAYHEAIREALDDGLIKNHKFIASKKNDSGQQMAKKEDLLNKPVPVKPILGVPKAKEADKKPLKKPVPQLLFELRGKQYVFQKTANGYLIIGNGKPMGKAVKLPNENSYTVEAGNLSGKGNFDDYGNFVLKRVNPVNKKPITDIMARIN